MEKKIPRQSQQGLWLKAWRVIRIGLVVYSICLLAGCMLQEKLIFFPEKLPRDYSFNLPPGVSEVFLQTAGGNEINALHYRTKTGSEANFVVLYFHGNAGSLRGWQEISSDFTSRGLDFLIIDFHGYGKSAGKFSEQGFYQDGLAAYEYLLKEGYQAEKIIIYGRSVGTGIAVDLAAKKPARALILESPFSSLLQLGKEKYRFLFPGLWVRYYFDNLEKAPRLHLPVLILHGGRDALVPPAHSERLFKAIPSVKKLVIISQGEHNDLSHLEEYDQAINEFLKGIRQAVL